MSAGNIAAPDNWAVIPCGTSRQTSACPHGVVADLDLRKLEAASSVNCFKRGISQLLRFGMLWPIGGFLLVFVIAHPWDSVFIGGDEGFELAKAWMQSQGHSLYSEIWNDQPPLLTDLLSSLFSLFGTELFIARGAIACFGILFFCGFYLLVRDLSGRRAALIATALIFAAPRVAELSVSVMQELPAVTLIVWGGYSLVYYGRTRKPVYLALALVCFTAGIAFKFTAVIPAVVFLARLLWRSCLFQTDSLKHPYVSLAAVVVSPVIGLAGYLSLFHDGPFDTLWTAHFSSSTRLAAQSNGIGVFPWLATTAEHADVVLCALIGGVAALWLRRPGAVAFPMFWLAIVITVFTLHRPWWGFYYLHMAIPLCWAAGIALDLLLNDETPGAPWLNQTQKATLSVFLATGFLIMSIPRFIGDMRGLAERERVNDVVLVRKLKEYGGQAAWMFTMDNVWSFHARLKLPPELVVVSQKRLWEGRLLPEDIAAIIKGYRVDMLLRNKHSRFDRSWHRQVIGDYQPVFENEIYVLEIRRHK